MDAKNGRGIGHTGTGKTGILALAILAEFYLDNNGKEAN